jgi:PKD repeat protein
MKHYYVFLLLALLPSIQTKAQNTDLCGQAEVTNSWFQKHPELKIKYDKQQQAKTALINANAASRQGGDSIAYTIPLVFHILHVDGVENISDEQIIDQVAILNRDYQKRNADTGLIVAAFENNIANVGFAFKLATIDPDGHCTNGIVRHYTAKTNWDVNNLDDFIYSWPTDQYLNIYVVNKLNINATAYSFLPGVGVPDNADVIVTTHRMVGSIGTATVTNSRVLTHEVAHWFDIQHTWGSSNAPGVACGDDLIGDTPETKGFSTCNLVNSKICDTAIVENVQNYMDYSPCKIMFTNGQADRMYATIATGVNNRNNIFTQVNQIATGMTGAAPCITKADFYTSKNSTCIGNTLTFKSLSQFGDTTGSLVWNFPGGTPSTSTDSIVTVTYPSIGNYNVTLKASGANGTDSLVQSNFIKIVDGFNGLTLPFSYDFEGTALPTNLVVVNQQQDSISWKQYTSTGANNTGKSIYLPNFPDSLNYDYTDWFETPFFDFSTTTNVSLSFYYAYAKRYATQVDSFKVQYSLDCGGSWTNLPNIPNTTTMATNSGYISATEFLPTPTKWKKITVPANRLTNLNNQPSVKFRFLFKTDYYVNGANNIYLDEINLTGDVISSISEPDALKGLTIYPNPSNSALTVEFYSDNSNEARIELFDITGALLKSVLFPVAAGTINKHQINRNNTLPAGIYLAVISMDKQKAMRKIAVTNN